MTPARVAEELLGVPSFPALALECLSRFALPDDRFEAQELGSQQSSVSSGAVLVGAAAAISECADEAIRDALASLSRLLGIVQQTPASAHELTTWACSQSLMALLRRPHMLPDRQVVEDLAEILRTQQDVGSGGWSLRPDEHLGQPIFAFYPALALARHARLFGADQAATDHLERAALFHRSAAANPATDIEQRLLSLGVLHTLDGLVASGSCCDEELRPLAHQLATESSDRDGRSLLRDQTVVSYRHPLWYVTLWRPLLYLVRRHFHPPSERTQVLLARELVATFDPTLGGWRGPVTKRDANAVSWATGLGLQTTYALARDLVATGTAPDDWRARGEYLHGMPHEFDVAISFAGPDRHIAETIRSKLTDAGYRVFYDFDFQHDLLGEDLSEYLQRVYFERSRFAIALISSEFLKSHWGGNWEWRAILARMTQQRGAYLLPYLLEEITVPGLNPTLGYVSATHFSPEEFARIVIAKLSASS